MSDPSRICQRARLPVRGQESCEGDGGRPAADLHLRQGGRRIDEVASLIA